MDRREVLNLSAAALLAGGVATPANAETPATTRTVPPGQPGDFNWLTGEWRIHHRFRQANNEWIEFDGEATCWSILGGVGHVEELRIPVRDFNGMGLRLLDLENHIWNDFWVNAKSGVLAPPGLTGGFADGVGDFRADDRDGETPIVVRGVWDQITGRSHRWRQGVSRDGGRTWDESWFMDWRRV